MLFAALCLIPLTASASYQPGQTLNPTCPPSDGTCVVVASTSPWTTSGSNIYYTGGNVGIGTTSPSQALSVQGNGLFSGVLTASVANVTGLTATNATTTNLVATNATTTNLAVSGAFTGGSILINQSGTGYAFSPPTFGGPWLANHQLSTNYTSTHSSDARTTLSVSRNSSGSGVNGPATADYGAFITSQKTNYLTSNVNGEIDGLYLITAQGTQGDSSGLAIDANKVYGGGNGVNGVEAATQWMDSSGNKLMNVHSIVGFGEGTGGQSGNSGYGFYTDSWGASPSTASPQVQPWAAFYGGAYDANGNCPMHCPTFTNLLVGAGSRSSPGDIYFDITGGLNQAGNIAVGSGNATGSDGNPTQSGGTRWSMENVNGDWRLYANNGTTNLLTVKQSGWVGIGTSTLAAQLEVSASFPAIALNDTHSSVTSGGLTRFSTLGNGITIFQINTAAAGDFSTGIPVYAINSTGNFGLGTTSPQSKLAVAAGATIGADYNLAAPTNGLIIEGNVGIGTTTPGSLLSVNGIANFTSATSSFYSTGGINLAAGCFAIAGNCVSLSSLSGLVGVASGGTGSTAFGQGWIYSAGGTAALIASTSPTINYFVATSTTATSSIATGGLAVGGTQFIVQQLSGKVGIGTNSFTTNVLEVNGNTRFFSAGAGDLTIAHFGLVSTVRSASGIQLALGAGGNEALRINTSGNVGIGTTTPYSRLSVWGTDTASSTLAFNVVNNASTTMFAVFDGGNAQLSGTLTQSSDARLKTNIQSLDASTSLASINSLIPVAYDWLDPNKDGIRQYGFIAQQVEPVFPNLVSTTSATALTPDGTLGLNYIGLIAPVIRAIQALSTEISSLENSIAGFADSFTTKELTFTRATGDEIDVRKTQTHELCVDDICVTRDQLAAVLATANATQVANSSAAPSNQGSDASSTSDGPPVIQINGNNPAHVKIGDSYADLGAIITGPQADLNLGIKTFLNGALTSNIVIDTLSVATDTIDYVVTDQNGLSATSTRTIIVEAATSSVQ